MSLKQLTIFVENKKGSLVDITKNLADSNVNLRALSIADTQDFGILRIIVNDNETATKALKDEGYLIKITDVVGETRTYSFEKIEKAIELVLKGAKLIGTNPDITGPTERGIMPATGSLIAPIEIATGKKAYFVGKPNPLMLRHGLRKLGCHSEEIAFIGDRMDTDIIAGIESNVDTVLVLSGVTSMETIDMFPYRPKYIFENVGEILTRE